jgi:Winged helix-turn helix
LIETTFGLVYTADHVGVMMKELGLSPQKPDQRNIRRDETKIQVWARETLPDLKKSLSSDAQSIPNVPSSRRTGEPQYRSSRDSSSWSSWRL